VGEVVMCTVLRFLKKFNMSLALFRCFADVPVLSGYLIIQLVLSLV